MGSRGRSWEDYKTECEAVAKPGITILGFVEPWNGNKTKLVCSCEIHGEWNTTNINSFKNGCTCPSCGGAKKVEEKDIIEQTEALLVEHQEFKRVIEFRGVYSKVEVFCKRHNTLNNVTFNDLKRHNRNKSNACKECKKERISLSNRRGDREHIDHFFLTGAFPLGTTFERNSRKSKAGSFDYWYVTCPICSNDEYVKSGVCSGIFESSISNLSGGKRPCRCASTKKYTPEQWEFRIKRECDSRGYKWVGWADSKKGNHNKVVCSCALHGDFKITVSKFLSGAGCQVCAHANHQHKECYINLIGNLFEWQYFKFGISVDSNKRFSTQRQKTHLKLTQSHVWTFPTVEACRAAEREVIDTLPCGVIPKKDMRDGYTETLEYRYINQVIAIYEKHGGELPGKVSLKKPKKKKKTK